MAQTGNAVLIERMDDIAILRLNRPDRMNCLAPEVRGALEIAVPALMADENVRVIVLTGSGEAFCAGGDLKTMGERAAPQVLARMRRIHSWSKLLADGPKPTVAAVNGAAAGAGFGLALLCDIVIVSDKAMFQASFVGVGAIPDLGLAYTLPRAVGMARAREILLTNGRVGAAQAVEAGLAVRCVPHEALMEEALATARKLAGGPTQALALTRQLLNNAFHQTFDSYLEEEAATQAIAFGGREFDEGVAAFQEKRRPDFRKVRG